MGNHPNILKKIKSIYILRLTFSLIRTNKKLSFTKYNKDLKKKLNIDISNYKNLLIFDLILTEESSDKHQKIKFINFDKDFDIEKQIKLGNLDIYCMNNNKRININENYLNEKNFGKKIKIIINNENNTIKSFKRTFYNINILKEISIKYDNCSIRNFKQMFNFCIKLISITFNLYNVNPKNMSYMFGECLLLKSIHGISEWKTLKNTNFKSIFSGCESLEYLPDISKWDTSGAKNLSFLFSRCCCLKKLHDISR